jgi:hypothetical protein
MILGMTLLEVLSEMIFTLERLLRALFISTSNACVLLVAVCLSVSSKQILSSITAIAARFQTYEASMLMRLGMSLQIDYVVEQQEACSTYLPGGSWPRIFELGCS